VDRTVKNGLKTSLTSLYYSHSAVYNKRNKAGFAAVTIAMTKNPQSHAHRSALRYGLVDYLGQS